jgi:hypothetical protein
MIGPDTISRAKVESPRRRQEWRSWTSGPLFVNRSKNEIKNELEYDENISRGDKEYRRRLGGHYS